MNNIRTVILGTIVAASLSAGAQKKLDLALPKNTAYLELGGNGLMISANYERKLLKANPLYLRAGIGMYGSHLTIPLGINYQFKLGSPGQSLELGFGATYSKADVKLYAIVDNKDPNYVNNNHWNYIPSLSYRKLNAKGFLFRIGFTPVKNHNDFLPFVGISIGKGF